MSKIVKWVTLISLILILLVSGIYFLVFPHTYDAPVLLDLIAGESGINISWEAVDKVEAYAVLKKIDGKWKKIADVTETSFIDSDVSYGGMYSYTVRCEDIMFNQYLSGYDKQGISLSYLNTPVLNSYSILRDGIQISWESVDGAEGYRIFRKDGNSGWNRIADVGSELSEYTDRTVEGGMMYAYTVRCLSSKSKWYTSGYNTNGLVVNLLDTPEVVLNVMREGVEIKWKSVAEAAGYRVFRKVQSENWEQIGDVSSAEVQFLDEDVEHNIQYYYTVRCISEDGKSYTSEYQDSFGIMRCEIPQINSVEEVELGLEVSWENVENAEKYRVYRKANEDKSWSVLDTLDSSNTSYIDENVERGNKYIYTVRCMNEDNNQCTSWYIETGFSKEY